MDGLGLLGALAAVWLILYLLSRKIDFSRHGVDVGPLYFSVKTGRIVEFLDKLTSASEGFWRSYGRVSDILGIPLGLTAAGFLAWNLANFFIPGGAPGAVLPVLPGITVEFEAFLYLAIPIMAAMIVHELAHGAVMRLEGIPVRSAGLIVFLVVLGAFVEPDEEAFNEAGRGVKRRILAAGSAANLALGIAALTLSYLAFTAPLGLIVAEVEPGSPASRLGLARWDILYSVDGKPTRTVGELLSYVKGRVGEKIVLETSRGVFEARVEKGWSYGLGLRLYVQPYRRFLGLENPQIDFYLDMLISGLYLVNISLAVFNMLPLYPLDGEGYLLNLIGEKALKDRRLRYMVNVLALTLLASNIGLTVLRIGYMLTVKP